MGARGKASKLVSGSLHPLSNSIQFFTRGHSITQCLLCWGIPWGCSGVSANCPQFANLRYLSQVEHLDGYTLTNFPKIAPQSCRDTEKELNICQFHIFHDVIGFDALFSDAINLLCTEYSYFSKSEWVGQVFRKKKSVFLPGVQLVGIGWNQDQIGPIR